MAAPGKTTSVLGPCMIIRAPEDLSREVREKLFPDEFADHGELCDINFTRKRNDIISERKKDDGRYDRIVLKRETNEQNEIAINDHHVSNKPIFIEPVLKVVSSDNAERMTMEVKLENTGNTLVIANYSDNTETQRTVKSQESTLLSTGDCLIFSKSVKLRIELKLTNDYGIPHPPFTVYLIQKALDGTNS